MDFDYAISASERNRGGLPDLPIVNLIAETPASEKQAVLLSRPGLKKSGTTLGNGPINGLFQIDGVLNGQLFAVSGNQFYSGSSLVGTIDGNSAVSFAAYQDYIFVNAGGSIWSYDGTTFTSVPFPDGKGVLKIGVAESRIVAIEQDTGVFYWSDVLTSDIGGLNFATAEQSPDKLKDLLWVGDRLVLFGSETIEFWQISNDPALPFTPIIGLTYTVGVKMPGAATTFNNSFAWVNTYNRICLGTPETVISDIGIQKKIEASAKVQLWTFVLEGEEFLAVTMDTETWCFRATGNTWTQMQSYGQTNWVCNHYMKGYFGSSISGDLYQWSTDYTDFGSTLERRFRAWLPLNGENVSLWSLLLRNNPGMTSFLNLSTDPIVEMRLSRDGGNTWGSWKPRSLGSQGAYRKQTRWNSLGMQSYPGLMVEFRVTDPVEFRISGLTMNESYGGR